MGNGKIKAIQKCALLRYAYGDTVEGVSLKTYQAKRDFRRTSEPKGKVVKARQKRRRFVIQKHDASHLHYDFRLELDGVLKSWAVPKGPSLNPERKALAVQVEDHPISYGKFEGTIPRGEYGGGTVLLWDEGTWEPSDSNPTLGLKSGKLHFVLHGKKLRGEWVLVRMQGKAGGGGKNWLLKKQNDQYASTEVDILVEASDSVKSRRSLAAIASSHATQSKRQPPKSRKASPPHSKTLPRLLPQLAVVADHPPEGDEWVHEIKFDGYRILAFLEAGKVHLVTRNGHDWTHTFPSVAKALEAMNASGTILDGELVVLDKDGRSSFQALQQLVKHRGRASPVYYVFDLPFLEGKDLRAKPLLERKQALEHFLKLNDFGEDIRYSAHLRGDAAEIVEKACGMSLEGIISKRANSPYVSRRDSSWLKSKCSNRQEFVIIGYTDPQGARAGFGALLLGYHNDKGKLVYAGRVGTGFDQAKLNDLHSQLITLAQRKSPTDLAPPPRERRGAHWVKPVLVCEVRFSNWTDDRLLRHPVFIALRSDKPASSITAEKSIVGSGKKETKKSLEIRASTISSEKPMLFAGVRLTHPSKVLYPDCGVTKQDVADYYENVKRWMLPHIVERPLVLTRCPDGQAKKCFYQRNWNESLPADVGKVDVSEKRTKDYHVTVHDFKGIVSLVQVGVLEIHTWNCQNDEIENPDQLIFDLDPGPNVSWRTMMEVATLLKTTLKKVRLPMFWKTSGGKGVHVTIPIHRNIDWDTAKSFCRAIVESLSSESGLVVSNMRKDLREGKVYIDYHRNDRSATAVAPYSTRARTGAPIAMPVAWGELANLRTASAFTLESASIYLARRKSDPWHGFNAARVDLLKVIR